MHALSDSTTGNCYSAGNLPDTKNTGKRLGEDNSICYYWIKCLLVYFNLIISPPEEA